MYEAVQVGTGLIERWSYLAVRPGRPLLRRHDRTRLRRRASRRGQGHRVRRRPHARAPRPDDARGVGDLEAPERSATFNEEYPALERQDYDQTLDQIAAAAPLQQMPVVVLSASDKWADVVPQL